MHIFPLMETKNHKLIFLRLMVLDCEKQCEILFSKEHCNSGATEPFLVEIRNGCDVQVVLPDLSALCSLPECD